MNCFQILLFFSFLQLLLIVYLLSVLYHQKLDEASRLKEQSLDLSRKPQSFNVFPVKNESLCLEAVKSQVLQTALPIKPKGVAITLMLHTPLWYQRRYTMMIQNTVENIPDDWVVQVFYTAEGQSLKGLTVNPGIQKFIDKKRVILTTIPKSVLNKKRKRFELMTEIWLWQNMLADRVLVFGGGSVICSNSPQNLKDYFHFDYIGPMWFPFKGLGGDGSISIRSRNLMVQVINYEMEKYKDKPTEKREKAYTTFGQEDTFFVSRIKEMIQKGLLYNTNLMIPDNWNHKKYRGITNMEEIDAPKVFIANKNDSMQFAAIDNHLTHEVLVVSGILPAVPFRERDKFIGYCPEVKMFYPSLHDPACFGASPDSEKCAASICALKPKTERRGGC
jgi:hypothetical protein